MGLVQGVGSALVFKKYLGYSLPQSILDKALFLWTGKQGADTLISDLDESDVITINDKDFTTRSIPDTSLATFNAPDEADYIAADADSLWFDTSVVQDVTIGDLIDYDYTRTIIKYSNYAPYRVYWIMILKDGEVLTQEELDIIHKQFKLWMYWSGEDVLNDNGYLKDNRSLPDSVPITDYDGNVYTSVVIGNQEWLVENLKTTHFNNGDAIPNITDNASWAADTVGAYSWWNNDIANKQDYGALYNYFVVEDVRGVCPDGFKIPNYQDIQDLKDALIADGQVFAGVFATILNSNIQRGGYRRQAGDFPSGEFGSKGYYIGSDFSLISTTDMGSGSSILGILEISDKGEKSGFSIRCVRDRNLLPNGSFDDDSNLIFESGWSVSGGVLICAGAMGKKTSFGFVGESGKTYRVTYTILNRVSGNVRAQFGSNTLSTRTANGTYTEEITLSSSAEFEIYSIFGFNGQIDNVEVIEI